MGDSTATIETNSLLEKTIQPQATRKCARFSLVVHRLIFEYLVIRSIVACVASFSERRFFHHAHQEEV